MLLVTAILLCQFILANCKSSYRDVKIEQGIVRGYKVDDDEVTSFYGIPYATGPTGQDRHKAPLPAPTWTGTFNATEKNIVCPQNYTGLSNVTEVTSSLDCLVLNVFVPDKPKGNVPVYVYITGGGYQNGFSNEYIFIDMVKRGIIVVTVNYRLGVHGFLCLGTEFAPGNAGMKDQAAGIQWVKKNIKRFGGNSNTITVAGSSTSGGAVELQMLSPMTKGLYTKTVFESGSAMSWGLFGTNPLRTAERFANQRGVYTNENLEELEKYFKSLTDEDMYLSVSTDYSNLGFLPCAETHNLPGVEKFIDDRPINIIRQKRFEQRSILSSFTDMEGFVFEFRHEQDVPGMISNFSAYLPTDIVFKSAEHREEVATKVKDFYFPTGNITLLGYIYYYSDMFFNYPQYVSARLYAQNSKPVYLNLFSYNGTVNLPFMYTSPIWGPGHVDQMLYIYKSQHPIMYQNLTSADLLTQERLRTMWYNFIVHGKPTPSRIKLLDNQVWKPVEHNRVNYLNVNITLTADCSPLPDRFGLWNEIYGYF